MDWWEILLAVRQIAQKGQIASPALSKRTGMTVRVASAWLSKLKKWGYVRLGGSAPSFTNRRWVRVYELTTYGRDRKAPKTQVSQVRRKRRRAAANPEEE